MRSGSSRTLLALLALYVLASFGYFAANVVSIYQQFFHIARYIQDPFQYDKDTLAVTSVSQEAEAVGLQKGDIIESLGGVRYRGEAQWRRIDYRSRPGDVLEVGVRDAHGKHKIASIHLKPQVRRPWTPLRKVIVFGLEIVGALVCLLLGYWVAFARPRDPNAWLILLLLTVPEVAYGTPNWWAGLLQDFLDFWYQAMQVAAPVIVLLIGVYFPERWRLDKQLPWLKWILIIPQALDLAVALLTEYARYYHPESAAAFKSITPWIDHVVDPLSLACVILFFVAIFDKLHSASTADARRRMRVLCAGSVIGVGTLLIVFVFFKTFNVHLPKSIEPWVVGCSAFLILIFPFSLAYVVVVQRALDVRILLRMGTKYLLARVTLLTFQVAV